MALPLCDGNQRTPASIAERHTSSLEEHIACGDGGKHTDELEREAKAQEIIERVVCRTGDHEIGLIGDGRGERS